MELGEMMEVISRKIETVAAAEFEKSGLPPGSVARTEAKLTWQRSLAWVKRVLL